MKSFILMLSGVSVILAAVWMLIPKGSMEKSIRYSLGLFFVASVVISATKIDVSLPKIDTNHNYYTETARRVEEGNLKIALEGLLEKSGIEVRKLEVITDNSKARDISINKVILETGSETDFIKAVQLIKSETGIEAVYKE